MEAYGAQKALEEELTKQKALVEVYDEQEALTNVDIEQVVMNSSYYGWFMVRNQICPI